MSAKNDQFQEAVEAEIKRISSLSLDWVYELPFGSSHSFTHNGKRFTGGLCHFTRGMGYDNHSLVLFTERKIFFGLYRKYLAGFSFNENEILNIPNEILNSCD